MQRRSKANISKTTSTVGKFEGGGHKQTSHGRKEGVGGEMGWYLQYSKGYSYSCSNVNSNWENVSGYFLLGQKGKFSSLKGRGVGRERKIERGSSRKLKCNRELFTQWWQGGSRGLGRWHREWKCRGQLLIDQIEVFDSTHTHTHT